MLVLTQSYSQPQTPVSGLPSTSQLSCGQPCEHGSVPPEPPVPPKPPAPPAPPKPPAPPPPCAVVVVVELVVVVVELVVVVVVELVVEPVVPVVVMIAPQHAEAVPVAMIRGMAVALLMIQLAYLAWPRRLPRSAAPAPASLPSAPLAMALASTAVLVPLMLAFLLFGLSDAFPVLVASTMLAASLDVQQSKTLAGGMILGNLLGGLVGAGDVHARARLRAARRRAAR